MLSFLEIFLQFGLKVQDSEQLKALSKIWEQDQKEIQYHVGLKREGLSLAILHRNNILHRSFKAGCYFHDDVLFALCNNEYQKLHLIFHSKPFRLFLVTSYIHVSRMELNSLRVQWWLVSCWQQSVGWSMMNCVSLKEWISGESSVAKRAPAWLIWKLKRRLRVCSIYIAFWRAANTVYHNSNSSVGWHFGT